MEPEDALTALRHVPDLRKEATTRVAGITWMLWGFAFAAGLMASALMAPHEDTITGFEEAMLWFVLGTAGPIALAAFATGKIWDSQAALPEGRPALRLAIAATVAAVVGWMLMWVVGFVLLVTSDLLFYTIGSGFAFSLRGGMGGLMAVAAWAIWFGRTRWAVVPRGSLVLGIMLFLLVFPLGSLARMGAQQSDVATALAALAVMLGFTVLGARLHARG